MTSKSIVELKDIRPLILINSRIFSKILLTNEIEVEAPLRSSNMDHTIFKKPKKNHGKGRPPIQVAYEYTINHKKHTNNHISNITIKDKNIDIAITTH